MTQESKTSNKKPICFSCKKRKDYGIWITSKNRYQFFCKECYQKKIEGEDVKNGKKMDSKGY